MLPLPGPGKNLRYAATPHGWESLGKQLILFNNSQLKIPDAFVGFTEEDELAEFLKSNNAWYHHNCYLDYSNSRFQRAQQKSEAAKCSRQRQKGGHLGEFRCAICNVLEKTIENLNRAAELNTKR